MISDLTDSAQSEIVNHQSSIINNPAPALSFGFPVDASAELSRLPDEVRQDLARTLTILKTIHGARNKADAIRHQASLYRGLRGFSEKSLGRKYYAFVASNDWRTLIDKAKAGPAFWQLDSPCGLPQAFVEFWKSLCERNQRKTAPARRALIKIWRTGYGICSATGKTIPYKSFPGYPDWSPNSVLSTQHSALPNGWSVANLNRHAPKKFELAAARQGREAAANHKRRVVTTRAGLAVGQFYVFDDQEYDQYVNFPGSSVAMRPVGLNCVDIASAHCVAWGMKPVLINDEGIKKKGLQQYMPWMVAHILCNLGHRPKSSKGEPGTHLIVEAGSATLNAELMTRIDTVSAGAIRVDKGQTNNSPSFAGLFEGASKGNPRYKAHIESFFNLVRNDFAALPAATGKDRQHAPAELHGRLQYNTRLLKMAERLSPERAALIRLPVMDFHQFVQIAAELYNDINNRTEHDLEGWAKSGHIEQEFFVAIGSEITTRFTAKQWDALAPHQRIALKDMVTFKSRKLSPLEVFNRSAGQLQKLDYSLLPALLGPAYGRERKVSRGYIAFHDQEIDCDDFLFPCLAGDGETYLTYQIPFSPNALVLADAKGRYVGTLERQATPNRADVEGIRAQMKYAMQAEAALMAPVARRALPMAQAKLEMHQHNRRVFEGQPITDEEKASSDALRERFNVIKKHGLTEMLDAVSTDPVAPAAEAPPEAVGSSDPLAPSVSISELL